MTERALAGRRIIVLGGTGGLGRAVVERFRTDGASVLVADARPPADADRHDDVQHVTVNALDEASVAAAFATAPPPRRWSTSSAGTPRRSHCPRWTSTCSGTNST